MNYRFDPEAQVELATAAAWYDEQRGGLGHTFVDCVFEAVHDARTNPERFPRIETIRRCENPYRRVRLERFPYLVIYKTLELEIVVVAIAHTSRRPSYWRHRQ